MFFQLLFVNSMLKNDTSHFAHMCMYQVNKFTFHTSRQCKHLQIIFHIYYKDLLHNDKITFKNI